MKCKTYTYNQVMTLKGSSFLVILIEFINFVLPFDEIVFNFFSIYYEIFET